MATFTAARATDNFPVYQPIGAGNLGVAYGSYTFAAEQNAAETLAICKIPKGAIVLGGFLRGGDMDTGSETLDIDVGYAANGVVAADPDAFGNFGILNGAAVTNYVPEGGFVVPLHGVLKDGPLAFTAETTILVTFVDDAATFQAGTVTVVIWYVAP